VPTIDYPLADPVSVPESLHAACRHRAPGTDAAACAAQRSRHLRLFPECAEVAEPRIGQMPDGFGELSSGRAGLLACIGLDDWIATDVDDYVARALSRAADVDGLARLRAALRPKMRASPLVDAPRFARNLEVALEAMWSKARDK